MNPRGALGAILCLAGLLAVVSPATYAQTTSPASPEQIQALQKKLDALQSQMAEVQGELRRLSGEPAPQEPADLKSEIKTAVAAEQKQELSQVEAELTPKQKELGQATVTYRMFSQDPLAAARINNEPLDPRFPGLLPHPGYEYTDAHRRIRQDRLHLRS